MNAAHRGDGFSPRRRLFFVAGLLLLAAGVIAAFWTWRGQPTDIQAAKRLQHVRGLLRTGKTATARRTVDEWLTREPRSAWAWIARGWEQRAARNFAAAGRSLAKARSLAGRDQALDLLALQACLSADASDPSTAQNQLIQLLDATKRPEPEACRELAAIALRTYQLRLASLSLERWMRDAPQDPTPYVWMTEIDGRTEAGPAVAVEHLQEALKRDPRHAEARRQLAEALRASNQTEPAIALFDELLRDDSGNVGARIGRGQALLSQGGLDAAAADFDAVLTAEPQHLAALRERAAIDLARNEPAQALARLDLLLSIDAYDAEAHYRRATALERLGRGTEAAASRTRAAQLREDVLALDKIQKAFNKSPNDPALRCRIAQWMLAHGQPEHGMRWLNTVLAGDAHHPEANRILAEYYEAKGDAARANFHRMIAGSRR